MLFLWSFFSDVSNIQADFVVSLLAATLATLTIAIAAFSYFLAKDSMRTPATYAAYIMLVATVSVLLLETGGVTSPFIALWMFTLVFAGIFGTGTLVGLVAIVNIYLLYLLFNQQLNKEIILGLVMGGELPILISYILWHSKSRNEKSKDRAYYDLANELNQVSNKSEVVINAIGDGVIAIDNQGIIELINPAAQRIIGWGRQDAIGLDYKSVLQLLTKEGRELTHANDPIFDVLTTNQQKRSNELALQTNSGKKINVSVVASPIGHLGSGAIIVFHDITKEQAEEEAQAEFISTASHEMRTPVAAIEGYLGLALNPSTATIDAKARDFITKAHESAQHLGRLFQDLLDVTKADDGRLSNNPKVIDTVMLLQDIIDVLKPKADAKGLRIFFKPGTAIDSSNAKNLSPVFYINLDADHLREVFSNLIENAIKYTPKGQVVVDVVGDNDHVIVSVSDSGIGIPTEDIPHLFQKFYRVDNTDTREIGGTGLGLYLCRRLIEAMSGRIWVESEYKKGSTFSVELPRISNQEATRMIEAAGQESSVENSKYVKIDELSATSEEQHIALATPIMLNTARIQNTDNAASLEKPSVLQDPLIPQTAPSSVQSTSAVYPASRSEPSGNIAAKTLAQIEQQSAAQNNTALQQPVPPPTMPPLQQPLPASNTLTNAQPVAPPAPVQVTQTPPMQNIPTPPEKNPPAYVGPIIPGSSTAPRNLNIPDRQQ